MYAGQTIDMQITT